MYPCHLANTVTIRMLCVLPFGENRLVSILDEFVFTAKRRPKTSLVGSSTVGCIILLC
jgi:hypothetical protein